MMPRAFVVKALDDEWTIPGVFEDESTVFLRARIAVFFGQP